MENPSSRVISITKDPMSDSSIGCSMILVFCEVVNVMKSGSFWDPDSTAVMEIIWQIGFIYGRE